MLVFRHFAFRAVLITTFACAAPAFAQSPFTLTLDNRSAVIAQGNSIVFTGTIVNISGQDQPTSGLSISYTSQGRTALPFQSSNGLPFSFTANDYTASYHGPLFTISVPNTTPNGYYGYPTATLTFSIDRYASTTGKIVDSTTVPFTVTVLAAAPEPSPFAALGIGILGLGTLTLKARKHKTA